MRTQSKHSFKGTRRWHSGGTEWARDGVTLLCADRRLRSPSDVLAAAGELPDWSVGRCWDRGDQLARHLSGFAGPFAMGYLGLSKGSDWQLYSGAAPAGRVRGAWRSRRHEPAH